MAYLAPCVSTHPGATVSREHGAGPLSAWQLVIFVLSLYTLAAVAATTLFTLPEETETLLNWADTAVCLLFLTDFTFRLVWTKRRWNYLVRWGWIDLVSSLPALPLLRWGRLFRVLRVVWIIRRTHRLVGHFFRNRAEGVFVSVALTAFLLVVAASVAILNVETVPNATITTASDALWWAVRNADDGGLRRPLPCHGLGATHRRVSNRRGHRPDGYTFTAYVASLFLGTNQRETHYEQELLLELRDFGTKLELLEARLEAATTERQRPPHQNP